MSEKPPVSFRFSVLHRAAKKLIDERMKADETTGVQLFVLGQLKGLEDSGVEEVNQRDLERASQVTHPTMTDILKRLERKGLVRCERSQTDKRYKRVLSTDKARDFDRKLREADRDAFELLCRGLSADDVESFIRITDIMMINAEMILGKGCECNGDQNPCREP